jgi:hypothetical protein
MGKRLRIVNTKAANHLLWAVQAGQQEKKAWRKRSDGVRARPLSTSAPDGTTILTDDNDLDGST